MHTFYQQTFFKLFIAFVMFVGSTSAWATHIVGGELELRYLGTSSAYSHRINMNLYFDDIFGNRGAADADVIIYIFRKRDNAFETRVIVPQVSDGLINYTNSACAIGSLRT
ncbi:MAG: gliding motility-associated C-terminal domain-containing protein, partial [Rudanella sp.]|nr:gliding motility-associated C-terminal domain-containing protein [Rudanella sp.]